MLQTKQNEDGGTVTFLRQADIDKGILAIADARSATIALFDAMTPEAPAIKTRLAELTKDIGAKAPRTTTLAAIEALAKARVEQDLGEGIRTAEAEAQRRVKQAAAIVAKNVASLVGIPDFRPEFSGGQTGAEYQIRTLRAEMQYDRTRADWRGRPLDALIAAYKDAHTNQEWTLAHALDAELRAILGGGLTHKALGEGADMMTRNRGRITEALKAMQAHRAGLIEQSTREAIASQQHLVEDLERQLGAKGLLFAELRRGGSYPLDLALKGR